MAKLPRQRADRGDAREIARRKTLTSLMALDLTRDVVQREVRKRGSKFWGDLVMARHMRRHSIAAATPDLAPAELLSSVALAPLTHAVLLEHGAHFAEPPDFYARRSWPDMLLWGVDQCFQIYLQVRAGRGFAAAVMARHLLERWTWNVASHWKISPIEGEASKAFISRVWKTYPQIAVDGDMGDVWLALTEFQHGRGAALGATAWERKVVSIWPPVAVAPPGDWQDLVAAIVRATYASSAQVRGGARGLLLESGKMPGAEAALLKEMSVVQAPDLIRGDLGYLMPLDLGIAFSPVADRTIELAATYRTMLASPEVRQRIVARQGDYLVSLAFQERRARAYELARSAFHHEQTIAPDDFDPGGLAARLFRFIAIAEAAEIVGQWADEESSRALLLAASALRSAWPLWLEDTDLSLPCVRAVLEQTCRARAWRLKPQRAERIEAHPSVASPARWIDASGWKRASILGKALGEYSHVSMRSRYSGAREVLEKLQEAGGPNAAYTARGHALDQAAYLLAYEVSDRLGAVSKDLEESFRESVTLLDREEHDDMVEKLLGRALALRNFDFGDADFGPAVEEV